jgi:vacuolar-type H+-ATPase subunit I/STV1|tara:strand:- start:3291 stop:4082 length:792 start_codon:yes stop_codon:yes gene_type:complete
MTFSIQKISSSSIWIVGMVSGLIIGLALGYLYLQPELTNAIENKNELEANVANLEKEVEDQDRALQNSDAELTESQEEAQNLRTQLNQETLEKERLQTLLAISDSTLTATLLDLNEKKDELKEAVEEARFQNDQFERLSSQLILAESSIDQLDAGKKLLTELRKEITFTRTGAKQYWETVKELAINVDVSLGRDVDKILDSIDIYFDWVEDDPGFDASFEEVAEWILLPPEGVNNYGSSVNDFISEAYLKIIRDIDAAIEAAG